jgi:hypothetical protein
VRSGKEKSSGDHQRAREGREREERPFASPGLHSSQQIKDSSLLDLRPDLGLDAVAATGCSREQSWTEAHQRVGAED